MKTTFILIAVLAIVAILLTGCTVPGAPSPAPGPGDSVPAPSPGTTSEPSTSGTSTGTIEVRVTDAPPGYGEIKEIWVEVSEEEGGILVHKANAEEEQNQGGDEQNQNQEQQGGDSWIPIPITGDNPFELLALKEEGVDALLGWADVTPGKYTQIRMSIEEVRVIFDNEEEKVATVPSGKLKFVRPFNIVDGGTTIILLDFIADKSLTVTGQGKVIFKPVVKLVVSGDVMPGDDEAIELEYDEDAAIAEWSDEQAHTGKYSIHLETTGAEENGDEARIVYRLPEGTTLGDINSISWWEYLVKGYPPHVDIVLDIDESGDWTDNVDDKLVFEYAYNTEDHYADAPMPYGALMGRWYQTFSDDGEGPAQVDDSANGWLASGPPGPPGDPNFIYGTLAEWKAGTVNAPITIDSLTKVLAIEIEVDNWVVQSEAYVDDIVVDYAE